MKFDNSHFEKNVSTTMSTLDRLKSSLNMTGAVKGLENVDAASRRINMAGLSSAVETVHAKFSALEIMGITALTNITNSAVNAGKRIVSALTIDPIKTGFQEYETQINSVQTILANTESKGTTLQDVNSALDTLNTYADKTIYNFTQMTRNIGTFTAAGVDLETSVSAIQGIANLAAVSGSTSQQASTAMYQLSQALATGKVKLQDWNSVVNAGMGGQVFQDALKRTATVMGTDVDALIKKYGSFRDSLTQGEWLTTDVLTETLNQFTMAAEEGTEQWELYKNSLKEKGYSEEQALAILKMANTATDAATKVKTFTQLWDTLKESAQSGWTQTWEIIMGDFGEAKEFLTNISDTIGGMIGASADARNAMLSGGLSTGWKQLLGAGISDETGYINTIKEVAKEHGKSIDDMIKAEKELDATLTNDEAFQNVLKKGLTDGTLSVDILSESITKMSEKMSAMNAKEREAAGYTSENVMQMKALADGIKDGSISMEDFANKISKSSGRENLIEALWNSFDGLMSIVTPIKEAFAELFPTMTGDQLYAITERVRDFTSKLKLSEEQSEKLKTTFKGLFTILRVIVDSFFTLVDAITPLAGYLGKVLNGTLDLTSSLSQYIINLKDSVNISEAFNNILKKVGDVVGLLVDRFKPLEAIGTITEKVISGIGTTVSKVVPLFSGLSKGVAEAFGTDATAFSSNGLLDLFNSGIFAGILVTVKKLVDGFKDLAEPVTGFKENICDIIDGVKDSLSAYQSQLKAGTLLKIATALAVLAASLLALSLINPSRMTSALMGMTVLLGELVGSMALLEQISLNKKKVSNISKLVGPMIGLSVAVLILASAMKKMADLDWNQLIKGLTGIGGAAIILTSSSSVLSQNSGKMKKGAKGLIVFSAAIIILAEAVEKLGGLDIKTLAKGLGGVGVLVAELAGFMAVAKFGKMGVSTGTGLLILSGAIVVLAHAVKQFGAMDPNTIVKGLMGVGTILAELAIFTNITRGGVKVMTTAIGLTILAGAMLIFGKAVEDLGSMPVEQLKQGLLGMGVALGILAVAMHAMNGTLAGSAAMLVMSAALALFVPQLVWLSKLDINEIGRGLLTLALAFGGIAAAGLLLGPLVPTLLGLSGAIALLGVGVLAIGAGLLAFSAGLAALAVSGVAGAGALVTIISTIIGLIPMVVAQLANGVLEFAKVIAKGAPTIAAAITSVILSVITTITTIIPAVVEAIMTLLTTLLSTLLDYTPKLMDTGAKIIIAILQGIADNIGKIVEVAIDIMIKFIEGISSMVGKVVQSGYDLMVDFINGLADGIRNNSDAVMKAISNLFDALIDAALTILSGSFGMIFKAGKDIITWFIKGISGMISGVGDAVGDVIDNALNVAKGYITKFMNVGGDIIDGLVSGISSGVKAVGGAITNVASGMLNSAKKFLGINSPSKEFAEVGKFSAEGLATGLKRYAHLASNAARNVASDTLETLSDTLHNLSLGDVDEQPVIRPVLDLSDVESGARDINGLFAMNPSLNALTNVGAISSLMNNQNGGDNEIVSAINKLRKDLGNIRNTSYNINGVTYDDGSNISDAVKTLVRAAKVERRV